jgi:DeoR/GlpR family transcriptional regulator of sugar metabolism
MPRRGTVFLDAGTTLQALARALARRPGLGDLVIVTNSLAVASVLGGTSGVALHVVGGTFLSHQAALMGPRAIKALGEWSFDATFLGGMGLDAAGISNSHASIAEFQQAVLRHSKKSYFCLDASKLGKSSPHRVADLGGFAALITDASPKQLATHELKLPAAKYLRA